MPLKSTNAGRSCATITPSLPVYCGGDFATNLSVTLARIAAGFVNTPIMPTKRECVGLLSYTHACTNAAPQVNHFSISMFSIVAEMVFIMTAVLFNIFLRLLVLILCFIEVNVNSFAYIFFDLSNIFCYYADMGGVIVPFSFNPLWKMLIDKGMTKENLRIELGLSPSTMAKMGKGEYVSLEVVHRLCERFNCQPGDLIEYVSGQPVAKD